MNSDLRQMQDIYSKTGVRVRGTAQPVSVIWHPWSLLLSRQLAAVRTLTTSQRDQLAGIHDELLKRLPQTVHVFNKGFLYPVTETLYVLRLLRES